MFKYLNRVHGGLSITLIIRKILSLLFVPVWGKPFYAKDNHFLYAPSKSDQFVYREVFGDQSVYNHPLLENYVDRGVVLDIGAHKGYFTVMASKAAKLVISCEPQSLNYQFLKKHKIINLLNNVNVLNVAISDSVSKAQLSISSHTDARHSFFRTNFNGGEAIENVDAITLNDLFIRYRLGHIDLLKLDCEGGEYPIIFSSSKLLSKIRAIVMEVHESEGIPYKKDELVVFLEEAGFSVDIYATRPFGEFYTWMFFCHRN